MKKLLVLFGLMFVIFACSNDCLNMVNECFNGNFSEKNNNENNQGGNNNGDNIGNQNGENTGGDNNEDNKIEEAEIVE